MTKIPFGNDGARHGFEMLDTRAAAAFIGLTDRTLEGWRRRGAGPPFIRVNAKVVRYLRTDLMTWIEQHRCVSTSGETAAA